MGSAPVKGDRPLVPFHAHSKSIRVVLLVTQIARSFYLLTRVLGGLTWAFVTLPWHRRQAVSSFRRALRRKGLSRREVAHLTQIYRERSLKVRSTLNLLTDVAKRHTRR